MLIQETCEKYENLVFNVKPPSTKNFIYEPHNNLLFCYQPKAATSTLYDIILQNSQASDENKRNTSLHRVVPRLFGQKKIREIRRNSKKAISFTMVRHPFERLVSAYNDKILGKIII